MNRTQRWGIYFLVFMSGSAGLIYEVVWHRYLAILLGAQARATALVLAVFLGGIATGYAVFGRWSRWKKWNLLRAYAYVEVGLFFWAVAFPLFFRISSAITAKSFGWLGTSNLLIDIVMSVFLIGFPTFLMGGTLPLLTQGLSEDLKTASNTHARIYGINTIGACFGCFGAGYFLIPNLGLVGATWCAALLNLAVAVVSYLYYAKKFGVVQKPDSKVESKLSIKERWLGRSLTENTLLGVGFLSGFYLITLQTVLIRLVGLSTGSSNYNFAMVVSIFIFVLGMGSLLARRISHYTKSQLFFNQAAVAIGFFLLYLSGDYWSYWGHLVRVMFRDHAQVFYGYQMILGTMFLFLFILPIGFAGLTLPLCFHLLKDRKETLGFRVGQLYGLNSLGCVFGALVGGYWLLEYVNLDQLFKICALLALVSTVVASFLFVTEGKKRSLKQLSVAGFVVVFFGAVMMAPLYSKERFIQPFRQNQVLNDVTYKGADAWGKYLGRNTQYVLYKDGPNSSVGVGASSYDNKETSRTIFINGKSDGNTAGDFFTTVVLAHIPGLLASSTENVCIIGFGTGITAGTMAMYDGTQRIDVAEISGTVIKNAREFDAYNRETSKNPKVHLNEMDAFRFLGGSKIKYDVVISEPSNPWVAGVENLFSHEFYETAAKKMTPKGMFVQWIHTYSFDDELMRMTLRTMRETFPFVSVFQLRAGDLALVGTKQMIDRGDLNRGAQRMASQDLVRTMLIESGISRIETLLALEILTPPIVEEMSQSAAIHTLENPRLSNGAARAFFSNTQADLFRARRGYRGFLSSVRESLLIDYLKGNMAPVSLLREFSTSFCGNGVSRVNVLCEETRAALHFHLLDRDTPGSSDVGPTARDLASIAEFGKVGPKRFSPVDLNVAFEMFESYKRYYSPISYIPIEPVLQRLDKCLIQVPESNDLFGECLLQKVLIYESVYGRGAEFKETTARYVSWFETLPKDSSNYEKLKQAREILLTMMKSAQDDENNKEQAQ